MLVGSPLYSRRGRVCTPVDFSTLLSALLVVGLRRQLRHLHFGDLVLLRPVVLSGGELAGDFQELASCAAPAPRHLPVWQASVPGMHPRPAPHPRPASAAARCFITCWGPAQAPPRRVFWHSLFLRPAGSARRGRLRRAARVCAPPGSGWRRTRMRPAMRPLRARDPCAGGYREGRAGGRRPRPSAYA